MNLRCYEELSVVAFFLYSLLIIINFCTVLWDHWMKAAIYDRLILEMHEVNLFETEYFFSVVN